MYRSRKEEEKLGLREGKENDGFTFIYAQMKILLTTPNGYFYKPDRNMEQELDRKLWY